MSKIIKTSTKFVIVVEPVDPLIFMPLREKYNVNRPPFKVTYHSEELGTDLKLTYYPPDKEPDKKLEPKQWAVYQQYKEWYENFAADLADYESEINKLLLAFGVKIKKAPRGLGKDYYERGDWIDKLRSGGITVTDDNKYILFLRTVVLPKETEYIQVLNEASAGEVTMADVYRAFDYFRTVVERYAPFKNHAEFARWRNQFFISVLGGSDGNETTHENERVVHSA